MMFSPIVNNLLHARVAVRRSHSRGYKMQLCLESCSQDDEYVVCPRTRSFLMQVIPSGSM